MSTHSSSPTRRKVLTTAAAAGAVGVSASASLGLFSRARAENALRTDAIRPFRISIPEQALVDLRNRINATRWPERETVADDSQGVPLAMMQGLARYWATDYDWRKIEA